MELSTLIAQNLEDDPQKLANLQRVLEAVEQSPGTGLGGTNYVFVRGGGTPQENAIELQAAYNKAKTMSPSSGNIITVVVAPGTYTFGGTAFTVNTPYINVVSLTGNADVLLDGINVTANNVYLKGLDCGTYIFAINNDLNELICENCIGGVYSFGGGDGKASGTFKYCTGGNYSFGNGLASGTFTDCTGGHGSFGGSGGTISSGATFENCTGGDGSFGGDAGTASGTFKNCTGGHRSFGGGNGDGGGTASGTFNNCTGGDYSFGGQAGTASGTFENCTGGNGSFGGGGSTTELATFINCTGGENSFGGGSSAYGTFENCKGGDYSFGGAAGYAAGVFDNCRGGFGSFGGEEGGTGGKFSYCVGDGDSFGSTYGTITSTARLYHCRLTSGTFPIPAAGGKLVLCIDGTDTVVTTS